MSSKDRGRAWAFTINNPTLADTCRLQTVECAYIIYGREKGDEKETEHYQGYIYFKNARGFASVKKILGGRCHLEKAYRDAATNREYCSKGGDFVERGDVPSMGRRTDFTEMREMVKSGRRLSEIVGEVTSYQCARGAELLCKYRTVDVAVMRNVKVIWYWGPSGCGKTYKAISYATELKLNTDTWISSKNLEWFDGYGGQKCVLLDDVNWKEVSDFKWILRLLDRYALRVPVKGGFVEWCPNYVLITCLFHPKNIGDFFPMEPVQQLLRRIHEIIECNILHD